MKARSAAKPTRVRCRATGKVRHATEDDAIAAGRTHTKRFKVMLRVYQCYSCRDWHLTKMKEWER